MYKITQYENIKNYKIINTLHFEDVLSIIKDGDDNLPLIKLAREYGKGSTQYDLIKTNNLPTFRCNFLFDESATNKNITASTGLIYIDIDENIVIPKENEYVYACWKSLSNFGYGVIVKVDNLTLENFKHVYYSISKLLGINSDKNACKATQQTVVSFDPNLYYNSDSIIYTYKETEKVSSPHKLKKGKECLTTNDTFNFNSKFKKVRFNNTDDYFKGTDDMYIVFKDEKKWICNPFIPLKVKRGNRNNTMYIFLSQIVALNMMVSKQYIKILGNSININAMKPSMPESEINSIINSIFKNKEDGGLQMFLNQERRILFNPAIKIPFKEKMIIVNRELGFMARETAKAIMYAIIEDWDFRYEGKITQLKVSQISGFSSSKIKRYWADFKNYVADLNKDFRIRRIVLKE
jgi:hypothetical protein